MARKPISTTVQSAVLLKSRRRCCICYGLNRDTSLKQGQIAHLDHNSANNSDENLVFLCLNHHDQYDSTTRQSKNLSLLEVVHFRKELYENLNFALSHKIDFGSVSSENLSDASNAVFLHRAQPQDRYVGSYTRVGEGAGTYDSAEITISRISLVNDEIEPEYLVSGTALWGTQREYGPNIGSLSFVTKILDSELKYEKNWMDQTHRLYVRFEDDGFELNEEDYFFEYGLNVSFNGKYKKTS